MENTEIDDLVVRLQKLHAEAIETADAMIATANRLLSDADKIKKEFGSFSPSIKIPRAMPGTVKPALRAMFLEDDANFSLAELEAVTGFKKDSIRGTMWQLQREGLVVNKLGRYGKTARNALSA